MRMDFSWLNENSKALVFIGAIIGWFVRLEVRLTKAVSKDEMASALEKIYNLLRPMDQNIAKITGQLENRNHE